MILASDREIDNEMAGDAAVEAERLTSVASSVAAKSLIHGSEKSLSRTIFLRVLIFTLLVVLIISLALTSIYYFNYENNAEKGLQSIAQEAAIDLSELPVDGYDEVLAAQFPDHVRFTLIASDGTVLFDSSFDAVELDNHSLRPEFQEAQAQGESTVIRYSDTLATDTLYAAVRLDDGEVLRLSETRESLFSFMASLTVPIVIAMLIAGAMVLVLSRIITTRIMKPIDALDFSEPLENDIYEEMTPLLTRIDTQQLLLKRQNEELARAESLRRDFSANVSHEMKTPLQVIAGYAELMQGGLVPPEDVQRFSGLIFDESLAMRSLIDDVLLLSRLDESAFEDDAAVPVDLYQLARQVADRLEAVAAAKEVAVSVKGSSALVNGNEALLETMIHNLVENAITYNRAEGQVEVLVTAVSQEAILRVSDTGSGIPEDKYDKVFERFYRLEQSRSKETGGTGLGLAIVKHVVFYHHGEIEVESQLGEGTVFTVHLPLLEIQQIRTKKACSQSEG